MKLNPFKLEVGNQILGDVVEGDEVTIKWELFNASPGGPTKMSALGTIVLRDKGWLEMECRNGGKLRVPITAIKDCQAVVDMDLSDEEGTVSQ